MKVHLKRWLRKRKKSFTILSILTFLGLLITLSSIVIPKIMAGDTVVSDIVLQAETEDKSIALTVTDSNQEDTKIVVPIPEAITYKSNSNPNIGVTLDTGNNQLVIDWVGEQEKQVTLQLEVKEEGSYDFTARTVREGEPVSSPINSVSIKNLLKTENTEEEIIPPKAVENTEQKTESDIENYNFQAKNDIASGKYGQSTWRISAEGTLYIGTGQFGSEKAPWLDEMYAEKINKITITTGAKLKEGTEIFALPNLTEIENLRGLDTSSITSMYKMFYGTALLKKIDLSNFKTPNLNAMGHSFHNSGVEELDLSSFSTEKITHLDGTFQHAINLRSVNLSSFKSNPKLVNIDSLFNEALSLTSVDLSNFKTPSLMSMNDVFRITPMKNIDISSFDTSKVTSMIGLFNTTKQLQMLNLGVFDTTSLNTTQRMFKNSGYPNILEVLKKMNTSNVTNMEEMIMGTTVEEFDFRLLNFSKVNNMNNMLQDVNLKKLIFPSSFKFINGVSANLKEIIPGEAIGDPSGRWTRQSDLNGNLTFDQPKYTSKELMEKIDGNSPGVYVWVKKGAPIYVHHQNIKGEEVEKTKMIDGDIGDKYQTYSADISGWKNTGVVGEETGRISAQTQEVIYTYKKDGVLKFNKVPDNLSFNTAKISSKTIETNRKDPNWKIIVEDTRLEKKPWQVTAKLSEQFKDDNGNSLTDNILLYRKGHQSDQWITSDSEVNVFDGTSTENDDLYDVLWPTQEGPLIKVAPGTVKVGKYTCVINWSLIDAPV